MEGNMIYGRNYLEKKNEKGIISSHILANFNF